MDVFLESPRPEATWQKLERVSALRKRVRANGYSVIPCVGKMPALRQWQHLAATNEDIDEWSLRYPEALNTGILTRNTPAIDVDVLDTEAARELREMAARLGDLSDPMLARVGMPPKCALLFRADRPFQKIASPLFTSSDGQTHRVEVLGDGQQLVVDGAHPSGRAYQWSDDTPEDVHRSALPLLTEEAARGFVERASEFMAGRGWKPAKAAGNGAAVTATSPNRPKNDFETIYGSVAGDRTAAYAAAALAGCSEDVATASKGTRNEALNKAAFRLGTMAARGWIAESAVARALLEAAHSNGLVADDGAAAAVATLTSGMKAGAQNPHPDLDDTIRVINGAQTEAVPNTLGEWDAGDDDWDIPPRGWLLGNVFCRRFVSSVLADGGTGKTALRIAQLLSLATGRSLTGEHVFQRCRVLIASFEDGRDELRRRLRAAMMHHDIKPAEVAGWLFLAAPNRAAGKLMILDEKGRLKEGTLGATLRSLVANRNIDIISLDPFVKTHGVEENNNSNMDAVVQVLVDMATECDVSVDIPHHTSKGIADPGNANRGRGASAVKDGGRLVYTLSPMNPEEAQMLGVPEGERRQFIRMDSAKVNITPPMAEAKWFRLVGVPLGNATTLYPVGDNVQTVERWTPPDAWDGLGNDLLNRILTEIDAGLPDGNRYSDAPNVTDRAAWSVVQQHAPAKTEGQCREIIKTWTKNGLLLKRDYENPATRKHVKGLYVDNTKRPGARCQ